MILRISSSTPLLIGSKADRADDSADPAVQTRALIEPQDLSDTAADASSIQKPVHDDVSVPVVRQQLAPIFGTQVIIEPRSLPSTSLDDLLDIAPIAEALIKTLAGKARAGRLDEMKALELLQQIVSL